MGFMLVRTRPGKINGLIGKYYTWTGDEPPSDFDEEKLVDVRADCPIYFIWWDKPTPKVPAEFFAVKWKGYLKPPVEGEYRIYVVTDDGCRVWVDGNLVIDAWKDQAPTVYHSPPLLLSLELHELEVRFYNRYVFAVFQLGWIMPNGEAGIIPCEHLVSRWGEEVVVKGLADKYRVELWSGGKVGEAIVEGGKAIIDASKLKEPVDGYFKIYDENSNLVFESPVIRDIWGGDVFEFTET